MVCDLGINPVCLTASLYVTDEGLEDAIIICMSGNIKGVCVCVCVLSLVKFSLA